MMTPEDLETHLAEALPSLIGTAGKVGVAVSGGGDSIALMHLLARIGVPGLQVATVDHGLRPESAGEADQVAKAAAQLGLRHHTLVWTNWTGTGNLQDAARRARQRLLGDWARDQGLGTVALGHTQDDQAETVLMRLARGSGVDGLSGMAARRVDRDGMIWLRPMLDVPRLTLRDWLVSHDIKWIDDPSNDDPRFDRVKARRLLQMAGDLGITSAGVADTATRMSAARDVLSTQAVAAMDRLATVEAGAIRFDGAIWAVPDETRWRILSAALCQVAGNPYRPRLMALQQGEAAAQAGRAHTLHGCLIVPEKTGMRIQPEPNALSDLSGPVPGGWAGWSITGPELSDGQVRAVGSDGLAQLTDWRDAGLPFDLARTTPGIWQGDQLRAAPALKKASWNANVTWDKIDLKAFLLSH